MSDLMNASANAKKNNNKDIGVAIHVAIAAFGLVMSTAMMTGPSKTTDYLAADDFISAGTIAQLITEPAPAEHFKLVTAQN